MEVFASQTQTKKNIRSVEVTEDLSKGDMIKGLDEIFFGFHF